MAPSGEMNASALQALLADAALTGTWTLDTSKSTVGLRSKSMWNLAPVKGVFRQVSGQGTVSPAGDVNGTMTVNAASIDTKMKKRDTHLRSADFFDSDTYPNITFTVNQARPSEQGVTVSAASPSATAPGPSPSTPRRPPSATASCRSTPRSRSTAQTSV